MIVPKTRRWILTAPAQAAPAAAILFIGIILSLAEYRYLTTGLRTRMFIGAAMGAGLALILWPVYNQLVAKRSRPVGAVTAGLLVACVWLVILGLISLWDGGPAYYILSLGPAAGLILLYIATNVNVASIILGWNKSRTTSLAAINLIMLTGALILTEALLISLLRS